MEITNAQYAKGLFEALKDMEEAKMQPVLKKFVSVLASHNKLSQMNKILVDFVDLWSSERGIVKVEIVSAGVLTKNILDELNSYIEREADAKQVEVIEKVDKSIIGGVILRHGDKILDMSIKNRLREMRNILRN